MSQFRMKRAKPSHVRPGPQPSAEMHRAMAFARKAKGEWCLVAVRPKRGTAAMCALNWKRHPDARGYEFRSQWAADHVGGEVFCRWVGGES